MQQKSVKSTSSASVCFRDIRIVLSSLLDQVLDRLEAVHGDVLVSALCLVQTSVSGLTEQELRALLGQHQGTPKKHYDVFEEKGKVNSSGNRLALSKTIDAVNNLVQ